MDTDDARAGWRVGLAVASYLRHYFPAFWVAHVAQRPVTTDRLIGIFHAFHELAHRELLALEWLANWPFTHVDPAVIPELVDSYRDEGGALWELANSLNSYVWSPPVEVYGLEADTLADSWRHGADTLTLAIWWMLRATSWSVGLAGDADAIAANVPGGAAIVALPALWHGTPMDLLADALTWSCPLDGITGRWTLGGVLRYVVGQTHNEFADLATAEALQDMAWWCEGIYDHPDRLAYERQKQRGARDLAAAYRALDRAVRQNPALLQTIAGEIVDAACGLSAREACPLHVRLATQASPTELLVGRRLAGLAEEDDVCVA